MKVLRTEFRKNGMDYKILERSKNFYFAELRSTDSGRVVSYESGRIVVKGERIINGRRIETNEALVSNEKFGKHPADMSLTVINRERCYNRYKEYAVKDEPFKDNQSKVNERKVTIPEIQLESEMAKILNNKVK